MNAKQRKKRAVVAMSGGVDSSVAAALLQQQGYEVVGVFMQFWFPSGATYGENRCCSLEAFEQAKEVADILGLKLHKLNFGREFKQAIVDEFLAAYQRGETPNPCVACNKFIKFDLLWRQAQALFGADYLATGHYVRLAPSAFQPRALGLFRPKDLAKDQTYFLYNLKSSQLKHLLFPLADYDKKQVRQLAKKYGLPVHDKKDSQEVCFVGNDHNQFLKKYLKPKPGSIIDADGKILGQHQGLALYTLGQRTGLGLAGGPWYVSAKNQTDNTLLVSHDPANNLLSQKKLTARQLSWLVEPPTKTFSCQAQIRYRSRPSNCQVKANSDQAEVVFAQKQQAIAPGQSVVFYAGQEMLGGGVIHSAT